jgi:hypothetical protein
MIIYIHNNKYLNKILNKKLFNHLSRLKFVTLTVFLFGFFIGIPSKHRFNPVEIGLSGIYTPLYIFLNFPVSTPFLSFFGAAG